MWLVEDGFIQVLDSMRWFKFLILLVLFNCQTAEDNVNPSELGYTYFPLEVGNYKIYQINSVQHFFSSAPDTINYQLLEKTSEQFTDLSGNISFKVERFKRSNPNDDWQIDSVWVGRKDTYTATMVEHNIPIIKLSFPIEEKRTWDANSLNDKPEDLFELRNVNKKFQLNNDFIFDKTATVIQDSVTDNILFKNIKKEIFSDSIGLIYKEMTLLNFCADVECVGQDIIETGIEYKQWIIEYGKE